MYQNINVLYIYIFVIPGPLLLCDVLKSLRQEVIWGILGVSINSTHCESGFMFCFGRVDLSNTVHVIRGSSDSVAWILSKIH